MFEAEPYNRYADAGAADMREAARAWLENLEQSAGLKWERTPDLRASE